MLQLSDLSQDRVPVFEALRRYVDKGTVPFHVPGHKQGRGIPQGFAEYVGHELFKLDITEFDETDDLHAPHGAIRDAQRLLAELYGAEQSFFMTNGTSGAIYAMILAVCGPGEKILVPRNAHRSVVGGLIMSGASPCYMEPPVDTRVGMALALTPEIVEQAIIDHPEAKAVLVMHPTYYGVTGGILEITEVVHRHGLPLLVDEAHGPHLRFSDRLPVSAVTAGADIVAQSAHKILGVMTQASWVHARSERISMGRLRAMLRLVQSTSPSYILMSSLDWGRHQMAQRGTALIERAIELAEQARERINRIPGLYCFGSEILGRPGVVGYDPTKLTVTVTQAGLHGQEAETLLNERYGVQVEMSDWWNVLAMITPGDGQREVDALVHALERLVADYSDLALREGLSLRLPAIPRQVLTPREAFFANARFVALEQAVGRVSSEIIAPYPPGIPILAPGEEITQEIVHFVRSAKEKGYHFQGPEDDSLTSLKVVHYD